MIMILRSFSAFQVLSASYGGACTPRLLAIAGVASRGCEVHIVWVAAREMLPFCDQVAFKKKQGHLSAKSLGL